MRNVARSSALRLQIVGLVGAFGIVSCTSDHSGSVSAPDSPLPAYFCLEYDESDCEYPENWDLYGTAINSIATDGDIDEDGENITCAQISNHYYSNLIGDSKLGEYIGTQGSWAGAGYIYDTGVIIRRSYAESASDWDMFRLLIHEIRHNGGHTHSFGGDFQDVSSDEARSICGGFSFSAADHIRTPAASYYSFFVPLFREGD